jgi:hypothetical protein
MFPVPFGFTFSTNTLPFHYIDLARPTGNG